MKLLSPSSLNRPLQDAFQELQLDLLDARPDQDPLQERGARLRRLQEDSGLPERLTRAAGPSSSSSPSSYYRQDHHHHHLYHHHHHQVDGDSPIVKDWALGKKHVFLTEGTRQHLEKLRTEKRNASVTLIQSGIVPWTVNLVLALEALFSVALEALQC